MRSPLLSCVSSTPGCGYMSDHPSLPSPDYEGIFRACVAIGIGVLTFLVFSPVLGHAFLDAWDDNIAIMGNPDYNPATISKLVHYWVPPPRDEFFVPVMYTLWGLVSMGARSPVTGGLNPAAFHALNLVAHSLAAVIVFLILRRLVGKTWAAATGALVFALHPIQAEAVAWASSAYTPISGLLGLTAVLEFLKYFDARDQGDRRAARVHYSLAFAAFLLAMLTKPAAVSVPLIAGAIEVGFRGRKLRDLILPLGAWVMVSVPIVIATRHGTRGATVGNFDLWQRAVVALDATAFYLFKIFWPVRLSPDYGRSPGWVLGHPGVWVAGMIPVAIFVLMRAIRKRAAWLNGAGAVFMVALLPTLGLAPFNFQTFSTVADRYAYLAMFGVAIVIAVLLSKVERAMAYRIGVSLVIAALAVMSARQMSHWRNGWTLFDYTLRTNPQSRIVSAQLGFMFTPASEAQCDLPARRIAGMADLLMEQKRSNLAAHMYQMAIDRNGNDVATRDGLARALIQSEQLEQAAATLAESIRTDPRDAEAHALLGDVLARKDIDAARAEYRNALAIDPENVTAKRGAASLGPATQAGN